MHLALCFVGFLLVMRKDGCCISTGSGTTAIINPELSKTRPRARTYVGCNQQKVLQQKAAVILKEIYLSLEALSPTSSKKGHWQHINEHAAFVLFSACPFHFDGG